MSKVAIVYWSGTGNTEAMAQMIGAGAKETGADVSVKTVSDANPDEVLSADVLVLGCPSMGDEILEEDEFEPFVAGIESKVKGKKLALFGSYDWGDGQWMRDWDKRMKNAGAELPVDFLIVNNTPEGEDEILCKEFGKKVAVA